MAEWGGNLLDDFAFKLCNKARRIYILAAKNEWPALFLHHLVMIKDSTDSDLPISETLDIHPDYNIEGGLRDQLFEAQSLFETEPIVSMDFDQEMARSEMPLTFVRQEHIPGWDANRPKEPKFDVNLHADYWDSFPRQDFRMTEYEKKPSTVFGALAGVWCSDEESRKYYLLSAP
jgi:hypothetical protein